MSADDNYAGSIPDSPPIFCVDNTVISESFLDETDMTDSSYDPGTDTSISDITKHLTRQQLRNILQVRITQIDGTIRWTIPSFPVLTVNFLKGLGDIKDVNNLPVLFNAILSADLPCDVCVTSFCDIVIANVTYKVLWTWDFTYCDLPDDYKTTSSVSNSSSSSQTARSAYSSSSEATGDDIYVANPDDMYSADKPHTLPFKVVGVTFTEMQQDVLYHLKKSAEERHNAEVFLRHEPSNVLDTNAVAVMITTSKFGEVRIGYIPKELTKYVLPFLNVLKCRIAEIFYKLQWYRPGHYMQLLISKPSKWHDEVIKKSLRVR
ncbi:uncharacterized protein LOC144432720 [Glandiceps talaboti]